MNEDAHLEAAYEDRTTLPDEPDGEEAYPPELRYIDPLEPDPLHACQRCERPGSLYDGEFYIGNEVVCWPCKDRHINPGGLP